ncbi:unnamed protein product [Coregonus sp. 'balchen']|nr:unnamed protein product [Coregonus sp. 'balchen']
MCMAPSLRTDGSGCGILILDGKNRVIFVTTEEHEHRATLSWWRRILMTPMKNEEVFSCFHYSKEEVRGSECLEQCRGMQECMQRYPELYPQEDDKETQSGRLKWSPSTTTLPLNQPLDLQPLSKTLAPPPYPPPLLTHHHHTPQTAQHQAE